MRLSFFFAWRYMFGRSRLGAVGWITLISAVAIGVVAMAMVLVLSVYNGYVRMIERATDATTPELIIAPREGMTIALDADPRLVAVLADSSVAHYALVLEGLGMLRGAGEEQLVEVLGVDDRYWEIVPQDSLLLQGQVPGWSVQTEGSLEGETPQSTVMGDILLGLGVLSAFGDAGEEYQLFFPRRQGFINPLMPSTAFRSQEMRLCGVLRPISEELDHRAYVNLSLLVDLLGYEGRVASYIALKGYGSAEELRAKLLPLLPDGYDLKDRQEQNPELTLLIRVEKFVVYIIMIFILLLATFNLISGLSMLVMEKRADLLMLTSLGMRQRQQRGVFALVGLLVSLSGASLGLFLGFVLGFVQQRWEVLQAGSGELAMAFPIVMKPMDFVLILLGILTMSLVTSMSLSLFMRRRLS